jgi:hypothetical protein
MPPETQGAGLRNSAPADWIQGLLMVSSFGFWAIMLGLLPVLLVRVVLAS